MAAPAKIVTAMTVGSSLPDGVKRLRLVAIFAEENLDMHIRPYPRRSPKVRAAQKVTGALRIVYERLMDVALTQVASNGGRITGTSTSAKSCSNLPHQLARRAADRERPFPFRI